MAAYPAVTINGDNSSRSPSWGGFQLRQIGERVFVDEVIKTPIWYRFQIEHSHITAAQKSAIITSWETNGATTPVTLAWEGTTHNFYFTGRPVIKMVTDELWTVNLAGVGVPV